MSARKLVLFLGLIAILAFPVVAKAGISSAFDVTGKLNIVDFENKEAWVDGNGTLLTRAPAVGDYLVSIFRGQNLRVDSTQTWATVPGDYFEGYALQQVTSITPIVGPIVEYKYTNPASDPFGVLAAGSSLVLFEDSQAGATDWVNNGTLLAGIASVTDGVALADFTIAANDYATFYLTGAATGVGNFGFMNVANAAGLTFQPFTPDPSLNPKDLSATVTVYANPDFNGSTNEWQFNSYGPMMFKAVPEPGTLAMWGGFLAIGAVVALRRRKK